MTKTREGCDIVITDNHKRGDPGAESIASQNVRRYQFESSLITFILAHINRIILYTTVIHCMM